MARTRRGVPYKHYWGGTKEEVKKQAEEFSSSPYFRYFERAYKLHGTDAMNYSRGTTEYYKIAHRKGRCLERTKLRPHLVQDEDYEFDDSAYRSKYLGVWWDIY